MPLNPATPYIGLVNADGPLAYYPLNGDATDWSGNNQNGTVHGTVTFGQAGLLSSAGDVGGTCALFDGSTGYISLPTAELPTGANTWSMEAWAENDITLTGSNHYDVVSFGTDTELEGAALIARASTPDAWSVQYIETHNINAAANSEVEGVAAHLVATYDGTTIRLYVNGVLVNSAAASLSIAAAAASIGRLLGNSAEYFGGYIQHVAFYDYQLSATQIRDHYLCGTQGLGTYAAVVDAVLETITPGSINVTNQVGQRSQGGITLVSPLGVRWQYGTAFELYNDSGVRVYGGFITQDKAYKDPGTNAGEGLMNHDLTLMDNVYRADKRYVFVSYLETTAGAIVRDLVDRVLYQEGVTYTATSIVDGLTIPEAIWNGEQISAKITWLAQQAGFWWTIDLDNVMWFQPYGGTPAPWSLDGTQAEQNQNLYVTSGNTMYVNTQYTRGGNATKGTKTAPLDESFTATSTTRSFTLSYPVDTIYQVLLDGVDVTADSLTKGQSGGDFYYAAGDSVIAQDPNLSLSPGSHTLEIKYDGRIPAIGKAQNATLVATQKTREGKGSSGIVESVYADTKVHTLSGALQIAAAMLAHYGQDTTILDFDSLTPGIMDGQMLSVNLPDYALTTQMLVNSVNLTDQADSWNVWFHIQCVGSPVESAQWQTYFQNLMSQQYDPSDLSDVNDTTVTPIAISQFSHTPSFATTSTKATAPIVDHSSGAHTMVCDNWTVA